MLSTMVTILREFFVYHDFVDMAVGIFGDATSGGHQAVMTDLIDPFSRKELSQLAPRAEVCSFGPVTGLAFCGTWHLLVLALRFLP